MKFIINNHIPFKGFFAFSFCGLVFIRREYITQIGSEGWLRMERHERIHFEQQKELGFIFFFVIYLLEFIFHLLRTRDKLEAYDAISFEREAYRAEDDRQYLKTRKHFAQWRRR